MVFTTIEDLTRDGRDRSLDYKLSAIDVPKGHRHGQVRWNETTKEKAGEEETLLLTIGRKEVDG